MLESFERHTKKPARVGQNTQRNDNNSEVSSQSCTFHYEKDGITLDLFAEGSRTQVFELASCFSVFFTRLTVLRSVDPIDTILFFTPTHMVDHVGRHEEMKRSARDRVLSHERIKFCCKRNDKVNGRANLVDLFT